MSKCTRLHNDFNDLTLSLLAVNFEDHWGPLQTIWIQMKPHKMWGFIWDPNCLTFRLYISKTVGGNNEFFENFERSKYLKKLPSMQWFQWSHSYDVSYLCDCIRKKNWVGNHLTKIIYNTICMLSNWDKIVQRALAPREHFYNFCFNPFSTSAAIIASARNYHKRDVSTASGS